MAGNIFRGVKEVTHYEAELGVSSSQDIPLGKTVKLARSSISYVCNITIISYTPSAHLIPNGDGTASSIRLIRNGSGPELAIITATVIEYD